MYYYKLLIDGNFVCFALTEDVSFGDAIKITKEEYEKYVSEQNAALEKIKNKRYYYKKGNAYFNLKTPMAGDDMEEITKEKFIKEAF